MDRTQFTASIAGVALVAASIVGAVVATQGPSDATVNEIPQPLTETVLVAQSPSVVVAESIADMPDELAGAEYHGSDVVAQHDDYDEEEYEAEEYEEDDYDEYEEDDDEAEEYEEDDSTSTRRMMTMTEHDFTESGATTSPPAMPTPPPDASAAALHERVQALRATRTGAQSAPQQAVASSTPPRPAKSSGPAPSRIIAAAASVSAGIGLVALMAGAQQDVVVQVNPTPITVQPANIVVEMQPASGTDGRADVQVRVVEPATPVERQAPQARVVTQSEGS